MSAPQDALIEIGTEELPPKALRALADAFIDGVRRELAATRLAHGEVRGYATPRRLAARVRALATHEPDHEVVRRGPAVSAAFDANGAPTGAARGFARSCGVEVDALERIVTDQGEWLGFRKAERGRPATEIVPRIVSAALDRLPIPKRMRWGSGSAEFVRPVHWVVLLHGSEVIDAEILGVRSGRVTRGHRFHHPAPIELAHPDEYVGRLADAQVDVDFDARRARIRTLVEDAGRAAGGTALIDAALLDEVTALVECPVPVTGGFDRDFLRLPREVLISTLQEHQRYFPIADAEGRLLPAFITLANLNSTDPAQVRAGNERVVRPRLADAAFFWDKDLKRPLGDHLDALRDMVYHERLGSLYDKSLRVERLAREIGAALGADAEIVGRAARLSRCDLLTHMVGEFPELQGVMGRYYASAAGEPADLASALDEIYRPRHAGDHLPATGAGRALAIADKLDTLVGIFGVGLTPTGDKDPYALRRAALGVLRICIESGLDLDLADLLGRAVRAYGDLLGTTAVADTVLDFMLERLRNYYADAGIAADGFEAVLARRPTRPLDFDRRVRAVEAFRRLPAAASLAAANKRIGNILRKAEAAPETVRSDLLGEPAERALAEAMQVAGAAVAPLVARGEYAEALTSLAQLREPVDAFFDTVLVMADDRAVRENRLALLQQLHRRFLDIADIGRLQG
ncbi:MAG: glycine--tRNA ligase subunit beta [Gammaproteobacteria bacterium]